MGEKIGWGAAFSKRVLGGGGEKFLKRGVRGNFSALGATFWIRGAEGWGWFGRFVLYLQ